MALRPLIVLAEWHAVPGVLGAVKRAVDADPRPGRYLITGSARADPDEQTSLTSDDVDNWAIEIKATSAPTVKDARHLVWLGERLPTLRAGLVLHTGPSAYRLHPMIAAVPIAALWA